MKRYSPKDPYLAVLKEFNRLGVHYVVVGMAGINYYAKSPSETFASMDFDFFLEPTLHNVNLAIRALRPLDVTLGTSEGVVPPRALKNIVHDRRTLIATTTDGLTIEFLLRISGYSFPEMAKDISTFSIQDVPVKVGKLSKLLRSKKIAGRPKDKAFLHRYKQIRSKS